ncbi:MAG TPA: Na/Pi symporter [Terracidiphilus sp.]|jgi:phosphate:Na+ symporter|nr:Na/Pi symporter [Terracidiphilus sp.]
MIELIALYMAGLSFFFTGMAGISDNLRQVTGQRFRILLARATNHPVRAGLLGVAAGAVTQSTSVVAFVLSGMIASGLLPLRRALVVLACANIGTAVLVFIAAVDLHLPILFLIGICGLILAFNLLVKWKPGIGGLLSIGLLFFGLDMMKQAFKPLSATQGLVGVARFFDYWPDMAFFIGIVMRSFVHSSGASAAITITINKGGMLGEFPAMMSMAGLGIGTAIATYFLSSNLRGIPRQIAIYQGVTNVVAGLALGILLLVERVTSIPLLLAMANILTPSNPGRMAIIYLILNLFIAAIAIAGLRWAPHWLGKMSPPTPEEDLSRPMYLEPEALLSPETAPDLVSLEQMRVMRALEQYLQAVRGGGGRHLKALHNGAVALGEQITHFLETLVKQPIATGLAARLISFQRKEETLRALEENVFLFASTLERRGSEELPGRLVEALDTILLTASDALQSKNPIDIDLLVSLTDDRGGAMERLRNRYRLENPESASDVSALHYATTLFERNVWLLRQLALWIREDVRLNEI